MKKHLLPLLLLLSIILTGCLDADITINVKKDGSGTIKNRMLFIPLLTEKDEAENKSIADRREAAFAEIAPAIGPGVKLESVKVTEETEQGFTRIETEYSFKDINKVRLSPFMLAMGSFENNTKADYREEMTTRFTFEPGVKSRLKIIKPRIDAKDKKQSAKEGELFVPGTQPIPRETLVRTRKILRNNRLKFRVKVDGSINSTNASMADTKNGVVTLIDMDLDKIASDETKLRRFIRTVLYEEFIMVIYHFPDDIGGADEKFEEIRYDRSPEITVEFK